MFGNLSKSLIKAPHYFNNVIDTEPDQFSKITRNNLLDTYSNLRKSNTRNSNYRYFKERDFLKKNLVLDLNYNNNFRKEITPQVRTKNCVSFEEFIFGNTKNNTKNITKQNLYETNKTNRTNRPTLAKSFDSKLAPISKRNMKYPNFLEKKLISKDSIEEFNVQVKTNINNLIDKINQNNLKFNGFERRYENNGKNRIENLKEFINKNTVVEPPIKLKFPEIYIKSQDTLYRETMDQKMNSLSMISPKIKEQLKSKNRVFASEKDFYRYNNSYSMYKQNPFYETAKYIEENK
jgi:hypothetical protein